MSLRKMRKLKSKWSKKKLEVNEKIEAEENKVGVELNNKGNEQKYDEDVSGIMTFPDNSPMYTPPLPFPQRF